MKSQRELLMEMTKDEMDDVIIRLGMPPVKKSAKKADKAAQIAAYMDEYGENLMLIMRLEEAEALLARLENGLSFRLEREDADHAEMMDAVMAMEDCGLIDWMDGEYHVDARVPGWLPRDEAEKAQMHLQDLLYDYMQGWLLHVGMMPVETLVAKAAELTEPETESERSDVMQLCRALLAARGGIEGMLITEAEGAWALHGELENPMALLERLREPMIAELPYPEFDDDALLFSARESLVPGELSLYRPLVEELERRKVKDADALVGDAVMMAENEMNEDALEMLLDEVHPLRMKDAQKVMELFVEMCNRLPLWWNKGHTPADLLRRTEPRRKAPMPGRNDPCTCGSGKKYKLCCGKMLH